MLGNEVAYHMVGRPSASNRERGIGTKTVRHESWRDQKRTPSFLFSKGSNPPKKTHDPKKHMTDVCSPFFFLKSGTLSGRIFGRIFVGRLVMSLAVVEGKLAVVRAFANANEVQEMSQIFASWDTVTLWSQGVAHFFRHFFFRSRFSSGKEIAVLWCWVEDLATKKTTANLELVSEKRVYDNQHSIFDVEKLG